MNKFQTPMCKISIGSYGHFILAEPKKAAALFQLLADCTIVESNWSEATNSVLVVQENVVAMALTNVVPLTQAEYDSIREAHAAEKAAQEAAA